MIIKNLVKMEKEDIFSKIKNNCPNDKDIERTKEINKKLNTKNGEEITELCCKSDFLLLACVFEKKLKEYQLMNLVSIQYIVLVYQVIHGKLV